MPATQSLQIKVYIPTPSHKMKFASKLTAFFRFYWILLEVEGEHRWVGEVGQISTEPPGYSAFLVHLIMVLLASALQKITSTRRRIIQQATSQENQCEANLIWATRDNSQFFGPSCRRLAEIRSLARCHPKINQPTTLRSDTMWEETERGGKQAVLLVTNWLSKKNTSYIQGEGT